MARKLAALRSFLFLQEGSLVYPAAEVGTPQQGRKLPRFLYGRKSKPWQLHRQLSPGAGMGPFGGSIRCGAQGQQKLPISVTRP